MGRESLDIQRDQILVRPDFRDLCLDFGIQILVSSDFRDQQRGSCPDFPDSTAQRDYGGTDHWFWQGTFSTPRHIFNELDCVLPDKHYPCINLIYHPIGFFLARDMSFRPLDLETNDYTWLHSLTKRARKVKMFPFKVCLWVKPLKFQIKATNTVELFWNLQKQRKV